MRYMLLIYGDEAADANACAGLLHAVLERRPRHQLHPDPQRRNPQDDSRERLPQRIQPTYAGNGPSEDFAESFMLSVLQGETLQSSYPLRAAFVADLAVSLTTIQSEYSLVPQPYLTRRIVPVAVPTPPGPSAP